MKLRDELSVMESRGEGWASIRNERYSVAVSSLPGGHLRIRVFSDIDGEEYIAHEWDTTQDDQQQPLQPGMM